MDWKAWFVEYSDEKVVEMRAPFGYPSSITVENLYQAFKARMEAEMYAPPVLIKDEAGKIIGSRRP